MRDCSWQGGIAGTPPLGIKRVGAEEEMETAVRTDGGEERIGWREGGREG